jgi:hypothetical protein
MIRRSAVPKVHYVIDLDGRRFGYITNYGTDGSFTIRWHGGETTVEAPGTVRHPKENTGQATGMWRTTDPTTLESVARARGRAALANRIRDWTDGFPRGD